MRPQIARTVRTLGRRANSSNAADKAKAAAQSVAENPNVQKAAGEVKKAAEAVAENANVKNAADKVQNAAQDVIENPQVQKAVAQANAAYAQGVAAVQRVAGPVGDKVGNMLGGECCKWEGNRLEDGGGHNGGEGKTVESCWGAGRGEEGKAATTVGHCAMSVRTQSESADGEKRGWRTGEAAREVVCLCSRACWLFVAAAASRRRLCSKPFSEHLRCRSISEWCRNRLGRQPGRRTACARHAQHPNLRRA